uniref:Uncharacterized protein n=1 Tax=Arundo donax TaxID=35708 RepID=A0A0A9GGQ7_ARUDO
MMLCRQGHGTSSPLDKISARTQCRSCAPSLRLRQQFCSCSQLYSSSGTMQGTCRVHVSEVATVKDMKCSVFSSCGVSVVEVIPRNSEISSFDFSSQLRDFHAPSRVISIGRSPRTS